MKDFLRYLTLCLFLLFVALPASGQAVDPGLYFGFGKQFNRFTITTPGSAVNTGRPTNGLLNRGRRVITPFGRDLNRVLSLHKSGQTTRAIISAEVLLESVEAMGGGANWEEQAVCLSLLGQLHYQQKHLEKAEGYFQRVIAHERTRLEAKPLELADSIERLGVLYYQRSFEDPKTEHAWMGKAVPLLKQALQIRQKALGPEHLDLARLHVLLGSIYSYGVKRYDLAAPYFKQVFVIKTKNLKADDLELAKAAGSLAEVYRMMEKYNEAEPLFKTALQIREKKQGSEDPALEGVLSGLTALYLRQDKFAEAEPYGVRVLKIKTKRLGQEHIDLAYHQFQLALLYHKQNQPQKAEPLYVKALAIREKSQGSDHADLAPILHNLAMIYQSSGRNDKAQQFEKRAEEVKASQQ